MLRGKNANIQDSKNSLSLIKCGIVVNKHELPSPPEAWGEELTLDEWLPCARQVPKLQVPHKPVRKLSAPQFSHEERKVQNNYLIAQGRTALSGFTAHFQLLCHQIFTYAICFHQRETSVVKRNPNFKRIRFCEIVIQIMKLVFSFLSCPQNLFFPPHSPSTVLPFTPYFQLPLFSVLAEFHPQLLSANPQ